VRKVEQLIDVVDLKHRTIDIADPDSLPNGAGRPSDAELVRRTSCRRS
jgi:hypothetical protein